jgi:hypothetical protein
VAQLAAYDTSGNRRVKEYSETVRTLVDGRIGVVVVDNPPVNAIGPRSAAASTQRQELRRSDVDAIVLCIRASWPARTSGSRGRPARRPTPSSPAQRREAVVAVLHGNALGGLDSR